MPSTYTGGTGLVEEIEAAAELIGPDNWEHVRVGTETLEDDYAAFKLMRSKWWPRIKEALLAGREMADRQLRGPEFAKDVVAAQRFRRADGGE